MLIVNQGAGKRPGQWKKKKIQKKFEKNPKNRASA